MSVSIGIDIGGTKIAGAAYDASGDELAQVVLHTPQTYEEFLITCQDVVQQIEKVAGQATSIGVCAPYADATTCANLPYLAGKNLKHDWSAAFGRPVAIGNDANCAALAEAMEGAGKGFSSVLGLILGTGMAGGFVLDGKVVEGANGLCGEIGHLPMPYYEESDGPGAMCGCGQRCIEKMVAGPALARLYHSRVGEPADARKICDQARAGNTAALSVLDHYYTVLAKALITVLHSFDPEIITVSGGLSELPGLYEEVPKRWGRYAICKNPVTKLVPAKFGSMAGIRGAAWLGQQN